MEDKVDELSRLVSGLTKQLEALEGQHSGFIAEKVEIGREIGSLGRTLAVIEQQLKDLRAWKDGFGSVDQLKIEQALVRKELDELRRWQEDVKKRSSEWSNRAWALISSIILALAGGAVGYFFRAK